MNVIFHSLPGFPGQSSVVYTNALPPSNDLGNQPATPGMFGIPSSYGAWQSPVTAPPTPTPGPKGVLPDQKITPPAQRTTIRYSPAPSYDPYQAL